MPEIDYSLPAGLIAALVRDVLMVRKRSFRNDAIACVERLKPPLQVKGRENIPGKGPCVVTVNHYYRPGFQAWWIALGITACVPVEMYWVMTGELTFPGKWYAPLGMPVSKFILSRLARIYGFTTMPPMPPRIKDVEARARAVREVLDVMRTRRVILGLAPEGSDQTGGKLSMPASGAGRFGLLLASLGARFIPVGAYESVDGSCLNFGEAYQLRVPAKLSPHEKDELAARTMMGRISVLLPPELRGEFV
jgi:hypothetical protein